MAKSPKKSRRGGRRSPKKNSKKSVQKISKQVWEQPILDAPENHEAEDVQDLAEQLFPEPVSESPELVLSAKKMLTHFFASLNLDITKSAWSLSELPEQEFIFGKVAAMLASYGHFGDEVEKNLSIVWKADETWTRLLLAGEVQPEPEAPEPEETMEQAVIEPEAAEEPEKIEPEAAAESEAAMEPEVDMAETSEIIVEETKEPEEPISIAEPTVEEHLVQESPAVQPQVFEEPMLEVPDKENSTNVIEDAGKIPFAKLGEQSAMHFSPVEGLAPKDVNVQPMNVQPMNVQPMDFA